MNPLDSVRQAVTQRYDYPPESCDCDGDECTDEECECECHESFDPDAQHDDVDTD